ncbi:MAG: phosphoribosyl-ATP diphosphatase [Bacteroidales bacterium]|nr:phosphoribosyl-ATP diphosphatase [Bacteroidales bacterium]
MSKEQLDFLVRLQDVIEQRRKDMPENSYTARLFRKGIDKIAQKIGEEAVELIIEARNDNMERLLNESADLLFHMMVLLTSRGARIEDVVGILQERHK